MDSRALIMDNRVLQDIVDYAKARLQAEYGFVGVATASNMAMLNSSDRQGNDIIIKIDVKPE